MANITLVWKGDNFSNHSSFKTACKAYGWNYDELKSKHGKVPQTVGDYSIEKREKEMTIECEQLMKYLETDFNQSNNWDHEGEDGDSIKILWEFGTHREYIVEAWIHIKTSRNEVATDAVGFDLEYTETHTEITDLVSVIDSDGTEVRMTDEVEKMLIKKLDL